ncbi:ABC transporter substrate-binding protein [Nocardiopsis terrae]|uniref:Iron complex transport system substrate-binding protein n=1 Tax=Nocardiopsis terrae TaxID=372655 RepID=A0ABR9HLH7_9ACTN|nr:ABC transporter substrate-binding protein [Nocardiopsis terrae]MBE1459860.1 iron complex transport system substrate-binding protein [Nocardiopsis terrae]GHC93623.1 ABC transporter substrate-binding protein [Nocardiopsis terrae]
MRIARQLPVAFLGATLALTACGTTDAEPGTTEETGAASADCGAPEPAADREPVGDGTFPVTVAGVLGEVTLEEAPERIVSLSPSNTEMLFAIGAGDRVEAADEYSNYPDEAPTTDLSGFTPGVEAISEYDPDLVILADSAIDTAEQLGAVDIPTLVLGGAADMEDVYSQIRLLGEATGHTEEADAEADRVESEFTEIVDAACAELAGTELTFYQELDDTLYSATSNTFVGQVYDAFGLVNIADQAADDESGDYPQLSAEFVVEENPDLIFLSYGDEAAAEAVAERPAFDTVSAVETGSVHVLDGDIASRWGPRVVDFAQAVGDAVTETANR